VQEYRHVIERQELLGVAVFGVVGVALIVLTPPKRAAEQKISRRLVGQSSEAALRIYSCLRDSACLRYYPFLPTMS
jgi:hypothetical protein